jgi:hypothetical protein
LRSCPRHCCCDVTAVQDQAYCCQRVWRDVRGWIRVSVHCPLFVRVPDRLVQFQQRHDVRLLQRGVCVSTGVDIADSCRHHVPSGYVQRLWRVVLQQLQRGVRVSGRFDECNADIRALSARHVQRGCRAVMLKLLRRLRVSVLRLLQRNRRRVWKHACARVLLPPRLQLHRRRRVPGRHLQHRWRRAVQQLQRRLCLPSWVGIAHALCRDLWSGVVQRRRCDRV